MVIAKATAGADRVASLRVHLPGVGGEDVDGRAAWSAHLQGRPAPTARGGPGAGAMETLFAFEGRAAGFVFGALTIEEVEAGTWDGRPGGADPVAPPMALDERRLARGDPQR